MILFFFFLLLTIKGLTYIRWGRLHCPRHAELTYSGFVGGSAYNQGGGGANFLCLPFRPKYDRYNRGAQSFGILSGTEYKFHLSPPYESPLHDKNVPCSVCYVSKKNSVIMVPGRRDCPPRWSLEYFGYLMTSHHELGGNMDHRSEYICVDALFETLPGHAGGTEGAHLWTIETSCAVGVDCPPYSDEKEVTCSVCSR